MYSLVATFYHIRNAPPKAFDSQRKRSSSFQSPAALQAAYRLPSPRLSTGDLTSACPNPVSPDEANIELPKRQRSRRSSYSARMSNWLAQRRPSVKLGPSYFPPREKDFSQILDQAERGVSPVDVDVKPPMPFYDRTPEASASSASNTEFEPSSSVPTKSILSVPSNSTSVTISAPPRARIRFSDATIKSQMLVAPAIEVHTPVPSPIYGADGALNANRVAALTRDADEEEDPRTYFENSPRSSGISGLLRQQEELERSIAALKLFSTPSSEDGEADRAASPRSDISLSSFPQPPWKRGSADSHKSRRKSTASVLSEDYSSSTSRPAVAPPTRGLTVGAFRRRQQSIPSFEGGGLVPVTRKRTSSAGTQYEITSFIGSECRLNLSIKRAIWISHL